MYLIDRYVPLSPLDKPDRVTWSKNPPRSLQREKSKLWSLYKSDGNVHGRNSPIVSSACLKFCDANHAIKNFSLCSEKMYERSLVDQLKVNPNYFMDTSITEKLVVPPYDQQEMPMAV